MDLPSDGGLNPKPPGLPTRSHLIFHNLKTFLTKSTLLHPEKTFTAQLHEIDECAEMVSSGNASRGMPKSSDAPGERFERRHSRLSDEYTPHPEKSLPLNKQRQELVDDIIALYSCQPTVQRVRRYTPDCIYDDQFVYVNDRHKMAGRWFALPKLFNKSVNEGYEVIRSDDEIIQFKNKQSWTFRLIPKTATITGLVSLALDPATRDSDFMQIKYHKDQTNEKDYSHEALDFSFKKWQADNVAKYMDAPELKDFEADKNAGKE